MRKKLKFGIGTKVTMAGFEGTVRDIRNESQRYVHLPGGLGVFDISDLKYSKKKKR
jgi:hypothetical protein